MPASSLRIRALSPHDLAGRNARDWLDAASRSRGRVLLAERNAVPVATIALGSGVVTVEPAKARADDVQSLRFARYRMLRQAGQRWPAPTSQRTAQTAPLAEVA